MAIMVKGGNRGKKYTKSNLPSKICVFCGRPFNWRKKWEKVWDEVKYCSDRCRGSKNSNEKVIKSDHLPPIFSKNLRTIHTSTKSIITNQLVKSAIALWLTTDGYQEKVNAISNEKELSTKYIQWLVSQDNYDLDIVSRKSNFRRLDESPDLTFYQAPRFVEHIDKIAIQALVRFHTKLINQKALEIGVSVGDLNILDLCSSWVSHLPPEIYPSRSPISLPTPSISRSQNLKDTNHLVIGLGMNSAELQANSQLTYYITQDLNVNPSIDLPVNLFDIVLIQLSIDYLTQPVKVLESVAATMRRGGLFICRYS
jgi:hypothetical protein